MRKCRPMKTAQLSERINGALPERYPQVAARSTSTTKRPLGRPSTTVASAKPDGDGRSEEGGDGFRWARSSDISAMPPQ